MLRTKPADTAPGATALGDERFRFGFGRNWRSYVASALNQERVCAAKESLCRLYKLNTFAGKTFLDIGCGSGLPSLAACLLGAEAVVSFDYDVESVHTSRRVRGMWNVSPERWQIVQGSILDDEFLTKIDRSDLVYSWGVLHHTGAMWRAIDNAVNLLKPGGKISIAIYNEVEKQLGGSAMWWHVKRFYNQIPIPGRRLMEAALLTSFFARQLLTMRNPWKTIRNYDSVHGRGMDYMHDLRDWVGGYPFEYASAGAVFSYMRQKHGLMLEYLKTREGHACNEFTFAKLNRTAHDRQMS